MATKKGEHTLFLDNTPSVLGWAAVGSKKESEGPLASYFDLLTPDSTFGEKSWEKAESRMQKDACNKALAKCGLSPQDIDIVFAGDLLNQCAGSTFGLRELGVPLLGLFGACSTMAESLLMASLFVEGGFAKHALAVTSSHFCSAERQFRFPLEYGGQRAPTAQWTATASGAVVVGGRDAPPYVRAVQPGEIVDLGIKDAANMGAAMAPAACSTISRFFSDTCTNADNYDLVLTGDLGEVGSKLLDELLQQKGYQMGTKHSDCGLMLYDRATQGVCAGASGCGCSASVLCSYILNKMREGSLNNVLFVATGALMSTTTQQQGESIPGIAHLVWLSTTPQ